MKKIFLFIGFTSLLALLSLFSPSPLLAAGPPICNPVDTIFTNRLGGPSMGPIYARPFIGAPTGNYDKDSAACESAYSSDVGQKSPSGYTLKGFSYCNASPFFTGDQGSSNPTSVKCYPLLDQSEARALNENSPPIIIPTLKPLCPNDCKANASGGCEYNGNDPYMINFCKNEKPTCKSASFGDLGVDSAGNCVLDLKNNSFVGMSKTEIHLCTPADGYCDTALGMIPLNPAAFVEKIIKLILGISGGIIIIMAIVAGYNVMTSAGDPQKLASSKELIVSIITGAFMIVFSMILLNAIGIDILGLPPLIQFRGYGGDGG